ncbi:hypothetical protein [Nonomuraea indica]|uniref:EthD domain-containing protein n=1 Tax=Nonomuraea indica TaxID=1581193 RepID=A0ABW7ZY86_9ACTN
MTDEGVVWDAAGRMASGRAFHTLTDEQSGFHEGLRAQLGGPAPLPYPEFSGPYQDFLLALTGGSEELLADWDTLGDGQALMAARNAQAETANEVIINHDRRA